MTIFRTPCAAPGCHVATRERYCPSCKPTYAKPAKSPRKALHKGGGGYGRAHDRWRAAVLAADPVCHWTDEWGASVNRRCMEPATEADHIIPVSVRADLRYDVDNGQGLCKPHHSAKTQEERRGIYRSTR